jgi:phage/plasmid-like protein (TIGR03299 family)
MSHQVETMAYAGDIPWHGLGQKVDDTLTPVEMMKAAQLDWTVSRRPAFCSQEPNVNPTEGTLKSDDFNLLVRDSDNKILGPCGKNYIPIQNNEVFTFFDKFVKNGDMSMGTAGSLDDGRQVWGLANIKQGFTLPGGDEVQGHLLISHPHKWGKSLTIMFTPVRVVCNNTLTMALGMDGNRFRMPHIKAFDGDVKYAAEQALGLATDQLDHFEEQAKFLASKQYKEEVFDRFLAKLFQPALVPTGTELVDRTQFNRTCETVHELMYTQPGAKDMSEGSWWSALNAVTYYTDHKAGRDRDASLSSAWFGPRAAIKRNALQLATEYAEAS